MQHSRGEERRQPPTADSSQCGRLSRGKLPRRCAIRGPEARQDSPADAVDSFGVLSHHPPVIHETTGRKATRAVRRASR